MYMNYPFSAIVGQEDMKLALILNLINPKIGGVLIRGEKGTAKSTAVRSLVAIMEEVKVVKDCHFHCRIEGPYCESCKTLKEKSVQDYAMNVVELPISATEDRVVGSLDMDKAIKYGEKGFEPGILAEANGNLLYVDEINLLDDHIVDVLLDAAAMGVNTVEREGISYSHPAQFILVGTMNPEEGDLRPQLLDRFGLVVQIEGEKSLDLRMEIIKRRLGFEQSSEVFNRDWQNENAILKEKISNAKKNLDQVAISDEIVRMVAALGIKLGVDGHRADITMIKTAKTIAAYEGATRIEKAHIIKAATLVLPHRLRKLPFESDENQMMNLEALLNA
ncbi:ATP-binding protein [Fusibacter sp. 3D3]|uniref:ATP-binding protein n=1 Tax=Fusibacter sp. 3D3 TaxID=1048380 RepID=UPI000852DE01|nr:AAA family ATPase [Fusibacter sp. 3D3]GAU76152.1 ChlI component of cobalt chelatase involved in B12 biosynthesis [Fusibacter sp. 3D3]